MTVFLWNAASSTRLAARNGKVEGLPTNRQTQTPTWTAIFSRSAAAALALWRLSAGKPGGRSLARIKARRAALGFPFRHPPRAAAPARPERDCDCVPWSG
ncbi:MAG: hypothetical protein JOZ66_05000 [Hyphomicrobiales bacterium]|nr:hypothetical protein [Hyphomicrobiales bacterium]